LDFTASKRVRGPTTGKTLRKRADGARTPVTIGPAGEDVRYPNFTTRLGIFTKAYVPLCSFNWKVVSQEQKRRLIEQMKV